MDSSFNKELIQRTGLSLEEIDLFYLEYTKENSVLFEYNNIEYIIKDIIEYKNECRRIESRRKWDLLLIDSKKQTEEIVNIHIPKRPTMVTKMIYLWESRIKKDYNKI